jgi:transcriptional regulator with XRE-family HTH domain
VRSKVSYTSIGQYERGQHEVSYAVAELLAEGLEIHVAFLWDVLMPEVPRPLKQATPAIPARARSRRATSVRRRR